MSDARLIEEFFRCADSEHGEQVVRYLEGALDAAETRRFHDALAQNPGLRRAMVAISMQSTLVSELLRSWLVRRGEEARTGRRWWAALVPLALAAGLVLVVGLLAGLVLSRSHRTAAVNTQPIASLVNAKSARWGVCDVPTAIGSQLPGGTLRLTSGSATVEFYSGARVTLTGPVEFGLNSRMRGELRRGRLVAYCPPSAHGFTIGAPGCAVVDLGTEFGVSVKPGGGTEVRVLGGHVQLVDGGTSRDLHTGEAMRVVDGRVERVRGTPGLFEGETREILNDRFEGARQAALRPLETSRYAKVRAGGAVSGEGAVVSSSKPWSWVRRVFTSQELKVDDGLDAQIELAAAAAGHKPSLIRFSLSSGPVDRQPGESEGYVLRFDSGVPSIQRRLAGREGIGGELRFGERHFDNEAREPGRARQLTDGRMHTVDLSIRREVEGVRVVAWVDGWVVASILDHEPGLAAFRFNQFCLGVGEAPRSYRIDHLTITRTRAH